jgi:hypothetical protein
MGVVSAVGVPHGRSAVAGKSAEMRSRPSTSLPAPAVHVRGLRGVGKVGAGSLRAAPKGDADLQATIERLRLREREAAGKLIQRIRRSEERDLQAVQMLAALDASLEATRAALRRMGYLADRGPRYG